MVGLITLLVASACRVDTTVDIRVDDDGSGRVAYTVVANADAVSLLVDDPTGLRFDDLATAGWNLDGPIVEDGGVTITASKPFLSPEELPGLLDELLGEGVVFSNVDLEHAHDFSMLGLRPAETSYGFAADVNPVPDLEILGDEVIEGLLGSSLGRSLTRVEEDAGGSFAGSLGLVVNVQLPANVATASELGETVDNVVTWEFSYGHAPITIDARASYDEILPRVWSLVAILAALLFVLVVLSRLATFVIVKLRTPKGRRRRDQRQREPVLSSFRPAPRPTAVVVDADRAAVAALGRLSAMRRARTIVVVIARASSAHAEQGCALGVRHDAGVCGHRFYLVLGRRVDRDGARDSRRDGGRRSAVEGMIHGVS